MNLLHKLPPGPDVPNVPNVIYVIVEVPKGSRPIFRDYYDLPHIPQHFLAEMGHFFKVYKDLEGIETETLGWERATVAREPIQYAAELYTKKFADLESEPEPEAET